MECRDVRPLVEAFVSEQLLVETMQGMVAHLERCAACRAEVDGMRRLRAATRSAFNAAPELGARPEFFSLLSARLQTEAQRRPATLMSRRGWLASAASVLMALTAGAGWRQWSVRNLATLFQAAVDDHRFCPRKLSEPPITIEQAARRYNADLRGLETVEPSAALLNGDALRIVERHSCAIDGHRFVHIGLRYKGQPASLLVAEALDPGPRVWHLGPANDGTVSSFPATEGLHVAAFRESRHMAFVVSSLNQDDVDGIARAMSGPVVRAVARA